MKDLKKIHTGVIIDETIYYTLEEICDICGVRTESIVELVDFGILEPEGKTSGRWKFPAKQVQRSQRALRLQHDLELDISNLALTIDLLEELISYAPELLSLSIIWSYSKTISRRLDSSIMPKYSPLSCQRRLASLHKSSAPSVS